MHIWRRHRSRELLVECRRHEFSVMGFVDGAVSGELWTICLSCGETPGTRVLVAGRNALGLAHICHARNPGGVFVSWIDPIQNRLYAMPIQFSNNLWCMLAGYLFGAASYQMESISHDNRRNLYL